MTTIREAAPPGAATRQQRRHRRRRLAWEQSLAVAFLVAAFAGTVVLLGLQWLHAGASGGPGVITIPTTEVSHMYVQVMPG